MKKQSNPAPPMPRNPNADRLDVMARVFNEWADRYAKDPAEFANMLDDDGKPFADYGESCAKYYNMLLVEIDGNSGINLSCGAKEA